MHKTRRTKAANEWTCLVLSNCQKLLLNFDFCLKSLANNHCKWHFFFADNELASVKEGGFCCNWQLWVTFTPCKRQYQLSLSKDFSYFYFLLFVKMLSLSCYCFSSKQRMEKGLFSRNVLLYDLNEWEKKMPNYLFSCHNCRHVSCHLFSAIIWAYWRRSNCCKTKEKFEKIAKRFIFRTLCCVFRPHTSLFKRFLFAFLFCLQYSLFLSL